MSLPENYCRVRDAGVDHVVLAADYGVACVCGRKIMTMSGKNETFRLADVPSWPPPLRAFGERLQRRMVTYEALTRSVDRLLTNGFVIIDRLRRRRAEMTTDRSTHRVAHDRRELAARQAANQERVEQRRAASK